MFDFPRATKGGSQIGTLSHHPRLLAAVLAATSLGGYLQGRETALGEVEGRLDERTRAVAGQVGGVLGQHRMVPFIAEKG